MAEEQTLSLRGKANLEEIKKGLGEVTTVAKGTQKSLSDLQKTAQNVTLVSAMKKVVGNFKKQIDAMGGKDVAKLADAWKKANNALKDITGVDAVKNAWSSLESATTPGQIIASMKVIGDEYQRKAKIAKEAAASEAKAQADLVKKQQASYNNQQQMLKEMYSSAFARYNKTAVDPSASQKAQQQMLKEMYSSAFYKYNRDAKLEAAAARERSKAMASSAREAADAERQLQKDLAQVGREVVREYGIMTSAAKRREKEAQASIAAAAKQTRPSLDTFKSAIKGIDYPLKNLFNSLTRIAKLRLLRGIIRSITGAFKEGLSNIYQYSAALNNTDASRMQGSLDSLATSLQYMKNAVGAAVAPLIASLIPTIQQVAQWFVNAASAVAQFFAALGGQTTYTKAKESAAAWGEVATGASGAAAAAEEYKNTILGFDEINALNDTSGGGGGGGGGGAGTPNYADMFEEAEIGGKIKELVQWLKDNWNDIWDIIKAIGASLLTWKVAQGVIDFLDQLGLGGAGIVTALAGLVITITGVSLAYQGGYDIGYEGPDLMNIVKSAVGVALGGIGGGLIGHGLTMAGLAGAGAAGAGMVLGFTIALIGTVIGIQIGQTEKMLDDTYRLTSGYQDYLETMTLLNEILSHNNTVTAVAKEAYHELSETMGKVEVARNLIPMIEELANKENRSAYETEMMKGYIEILNGLGLDGISAEFDEYTGKVQFSTENVWEHLSAIEEAAKREAYIKILQAAWQDEAQALIDNRIAMEARSHASEELEKANRALMEYEQKYSGTLEYNRDKHKQLEQAVYDWREAETTAYEAVEKSNARQKEAAEYARNAEAAYADLSKEISGAKSATDEYTASNEKSQRASDNTSNHLKQLELSTKGAREETKRAHDAIKAYNEYNPTMQNAQSGMEACTKKVLETKEKILEAHNATKDYESYRPNFNGVNNGLDDVKKHSGSAKSSIDEIKNATTQLDGYNLVGAGTKRGLNEISSTASDTAWYLNAVASNGYAISGTSINSWAMRSGLQEIRNEADWTKSSIQGIIDTAWQLSNTRIAPGSGGSGGHYSYADGGFVPGFANGGIVPGFASGGIHSANLFAAHENGAPELVGRIGNHTAVANTSQMVEAMAEGVRRAMMSAQGGQTSNTEVTVYMNDEVVARSADRGNKALNRRYSVTLA